MATLKSIKNKYLTASDGTVLGVTTNTENVSLLSFKLATADSLSKFNLVDGFSDDYNDATGVDASGSTNETRNAANYYTGSSSSSAVEALTTVGTANWTAPAALTGTIELLVIAGGGGGGYDQGGGGGAGGLAYHTGWAGSGGVQYAYTIGAGGAGSGTASSDAPSGSNTTWDNSGTVATVTTNGGAGGAGLQSGPPAAGGSGAGGNSGWFTSSAASSANQPNPTGGAVGYGNAGGNGTGAGPGPGNWASAGGGGGAGGAGTAGSNPISGPGGIGRLYTTFGAYGTDASNNTSPPTGKGYFAGGGAGGYYSRPQGNGGVGGGGGPGGHGSANAIDGTGGGGAGCHTGGCGSGGDGAIYLAYNTESFLDMTLASNAYTAQTEPDTVRIIMDEYTATGSSTLNTDIKAYASRDNGTTYTQITLASQGTIETNHRLLSGSIDISGQPSGSSVKYKIETLNQGASKNTRVYGTSMAWA